MDPTKELLNLILTLLESADQILQQADSISCHINNNQMINFHYASALSRYEYGADLAIKDLINCVKSITNNLKEA